MTGNLPAILIATLSIIATLCFLAVIADLRRGTSRMAHEGYDNARAQLPLNFWLSVGSKLFGGVLAVVLATAVWLARA